MITRRQNAHHRVVLQVFDEFDPAAARRLHEMLEGEAMAEQVVVDFTRACGCNDSSMALLARALADAPTRVAVVGLGEHQHRLLRYLGLGDATLRRGDRDS